MSNEVVKYKNDLNKFSFSGLTETELDVIFAIFHKFKEKGQTEIFFQISYKTVDCHSFSSNR